jgi:hypothetical protein
VSDVTSIDASEVDRIGDAVLDVAGRIERIAGGMRDWQYAAHDAVDGAEMCYSATSYAAGAWLHTLEDMADAVREFGGGLRRVAADYRQSDSGAAARVREAGAGQAAYGQAGAGQAAYGQAGAGQAAYGQAGAGQAAYGQAGAGQAGDGRAGFGQALGEVGGEAGGAAAREAGF